MIYLLDANVFMQAKNLHYGFDFCPAFWDWLIEKNEAEIVYSIDKVADEIKAGEDELTQWAAQCKKTFFRNTNAHILPHFATVSTWITGQDYTQSAINTFLQDADYYLVAHALADTCIVVTHEVPSDSYKKIKIPNVCAGLNVKCMTPFQMLRAENARFVLG